MKRLRTWILGLTAFLLAGYYFLFADPRTFGGDTPSFSLHDARTYAAATDGPEPVEIRVELISMSGFPKIATLAGGGWDTQPIGIYSFQVVYENGETLLIDTALDETLSKALSKDATFDAAAYKRMQAAMLKADKIVLTHEHMDHIGGLTAHPQLQNVLDRTELTAEQINHPERQLPAAFPEGSLEGYVPISYEDYHAVKPGVALIKTPGHSPGSQLILVTLKNGNEFLFVGDIAWHEDNIHREVGRPRAVSWLFLREDRATVAEQLKALKSLSDQEPSLNLVVAHDPDQVAAYISAGLFQKGFE